MADEARLRGLTEEDYKRWRHHPVTVLVRQYLRDLQGDLRRQAIEAWEAGRLQLSAESDIRTRIHVVEAFLTLPFDAMVAFYEQSGVVPGDEEEETDAA